jgi:hypothetical protein
MLVIHIGPRKTATTYLQSNFYRNRRELLKKGWLYPALSLRARNAHHDIVSSKAEVKSGKGPLVRSMAKAGALAAKKSANILISSENFRKWKPDELVLIGSRLGQKDILIVYTLRDPVDLLLSGWSESVKLGKTASLPDYIDKHLSEPMASPVANCLNQLEPILAHPDLKLRVLNFEALKRDKLDIYTAFGRHVLGLDDLEPARTKPANQSFPAEINDFLRLLSRDMDFNAKTADQILSRQFSRTHSPAEIEQIASVVRRVGKEACEPVILARAEPWYDLLEARIRERLGEMIRPAPADRLFPRDQVEALSYDIDRLASHAEIKALVDQSIAKVRKARLRWGRSRIAAAWRYIRRMISV